MSDLMTVDDLREYLRVGRNKAYEVLKDPCFPKVKIGRGYRTRKCWVDEWLDNSASYPREGGDELACIK